MTASTARQAGYGVVGLVLTWFFNLRYDGSVSYLAAWFANDASSSAAVDLLVVSAVLTVFVVAESRRARPADVRAGAVRRARVLVAMACAVPLFLLYRERRLTS